MCVLFISWQGEMTSNSRSIARTTTQQRGRAVTPKSQSPRVYQQDTVTFVLICNEQISFFAQERLFLVASDFSDTKSKPC